MGKKVTSLEIQNLLDLLNKYKKNGITHVDLECDTDENSIKFFPHEPKASPGRIRLEDYEI